MSKEQNDSELFQGLILSLAAAVMQHLGKTLNPMTHKIEKNMQAAQGTIDMLDMLQIKTQGNLSENEGKLMKSVLAELKLNYVETLNEKSSEEPGTPADAPVPEAEKKPEQAE